MACLVTSIGLTIYQSTFPILSSNYTQHNPALVHNLTSRAYSMFHSIQLLKESFNETRRKNPLGIVSYVTRGRSKHVDQMLSQKWNHSNPIESAWNWSRKIACNVLLTSSASLTMKKTEKRFSIHIFHVFYLFLHSTGIPMSSNIKIHRLVFFHPSVDRMKAKNKHKWN